MMEFLIDLVCQLPTRRFLVAFIKSSQLTAKITIFFSQHKNEKSLSLLRKQLHDLKFYLDFEIDNYTGEALTDEVNDRFRHFIIIYFLVLHNLHATSLIRRT